MPEVNVEQPAVTRQHDVVIMPIAYAQNIGCNTIACAGARKVIVYSVHVAIVALQAQVKDMS